MVMSKKWSIKWITKETLWVLFMFFVMSLVVNYIRKPDIQATIYDLELSDISGKKVDLKSYDGKPLIVHFWATWCPTCRLEASNIDTLSKKYNLLSIAVTSGSDEKLKTFMKENKLAYTVVNDAQGVLSRKFGIQAFPTTLIYNKNGELKFTEVGYSTTLGLEARITLIN